MMEPSDAAGVAPGPVDPVAFYERSLCWLGRSKEAYRLLSEAVIPKLSTWLRGRTDTRSVRDWQPTDVRAILFPVVTCAETSTPLTCEALLLCGSGSYYNPCDLAVLVFVQRPEERMSALVQRLRASEALIRRGPDVTIEQISLSMNKRDYINHRFLIWPARLSTAQEETLTEQGFALIRLSPALATLG
jgi:hypothetical protein